MKHGFKDNRRARPRFAIDREMRYKLMENNKVVETGTGTTIDISSRGVSFLADHRLAPGAFVELSISWPAMLENDLPLRLVVFGRIMRTEEFKAVATIEKYEFRTQPRAPLAGAAPRGDTMLRRWVDETRRFESRAAGAQF